MKKIIYVVIVSNLLLTSCNAVRESAGVNRKSIDEYSVIKNPPLIIPPDFNLMPLEQIQSKNIDNTDKDLAKEILFGLDDEASQSNGDNSLINQIIKDTNADSIGNEIRNIIDQEFGGIKPSSDDEEIFKNEEELNIAIEETSKLNNSETSVEKKEKRKKRFFFF